MDPIVVETSSEADTMRLGAVLADVLPNGITVALCGTLGAGKTRLVQAVAESSGVDRRDVLSPTFVLVQEYHGRRSIFHIDVYRLRDEDEFLALGSDEIFDGDGLVFVEWADRVQNCLPKDHIEIRIEVVGPDSRRFLISATGGKSSELLSFLKKRLIDNPPPAD